PRRSSDLPSSRDPTSRSPTPMPSARPASTASCTPPESRPATRASPPWTRRMPTAPASTATIRDDGSVMKLQSHGITTDLPAGWEGRITVRNSPTTVDRSLGADRAGPVGHPGETAWPVAHLGNFPLPEHRGDFGSGAVDVMTDQDVLVVLAEYGPECAGTALFKHKGLPTNLT